MDLFLADSMQHVPFPPDKRQNMGEVNIGRSVEHGLIIQQQDMKVLDRLGITSLGCFKAELDSLYVHAGARFQKYWGNYKKALLDLKGWPLWIFLLLEARIKAASSLEANHIEQTLGPLGAQIIAEQMVWVLQQDQDSYLNSYPSWHPLLGLPDGYVPLCKTYPSNEAPTALSFSMADVMHIAQQGFNSSF